MSIGFVFFVLAAMLFFFAAVGVAFIPAPLPWGLFCLTLGMLTAGYRVPGTVKD